MLYNANIRKTSPAPGGHVFQHIWLIWTNPVEGPPRNICAKYFYKKILKFWQFSPFLMLQQPKFYMELNSLNNFKRGPPKDHCFGVILKSVHWLCHLKKIVNRQMDVQTMMLDAERKNFFKVITGKSWKHCGKRRNWSLC